ncbi:TIGR04219 family outer membrane beta-barrel protein [Shewanella gelidii]|uniref:Outer membrane protein n=1 Tax=Shewanella gelidii TaxID=1642821 RepID=A0A917JPX3_9GAMM|nr:TIGR04219 family outer membrane beta-barrel protein [Shewanella gelidii]MCL1097722.1 TIGR04219 family outer membrane beta-barrel protein [Shewanella gelidii]GGI79293.1 outer membrane protein [Shewanella gelidii]
MKKTLITAAVLGAIAAGSAQAATIVGFKVGADYWKADTSGSFAEHPGVQQTFDYDSSAQHSLWVGFEHPVPFLPNFKLRQNNLDEKGSLNGADFNFNDHNFVGDVTTNMDLSNTDFVLYYEILDNDIVELDLGAAYKLMQGSVRVVDPGHPEEIDLDSGVVMAYGAAEVGIPGIGLYGFAELFMGATESSVTDYALGVGWEYDGLTADYKIRAGYREFQFDVKDFSDLTMDMKTDGYFVGVEVDF